MPYIGQQPTNVAFLTDQFSGNGSTTAFTLSAAPANTSSILVAISGVLQDPSTYSVSGTTLTFSPAPPSGTGNISVRFLGIPASGVTTTAYRTVTEFTATAGQTTFSVPSYTPGFIDVYRNGVMLGSADYTATNGVSVVLVNACTVGDLVEVISFQVSSVLNAIPATAGSVGTMFLADNSVSTAKIQDNAITTAKIAPGAVIAADIAAGQTFALNGVQFPATQVPSADANTLDDYEEGTWTPTLRFGGGTTGITYTTRNGTYTKIGRLVHARCVIFLTNKGSSTGAADIFGLPFTPYSTDSADRTTASIYINNTTGLSNLFIQPLILSDGSNRFDINTFNGTSDGNATNSNFTNTTYLVCSIMYQTT